jgi:hypothetical protein
MKTKTLGLIALLLAGCSTQRQIPPGVYASCQVTTSILQQSEPNRDSRDLVKICLAQAGYGE